MFRARQNENIRNEDGLGKNSKFRKNLLKMQKISACLLYTNNILPGYLDKVFAVDTMQKNTAEIKKKSVLPIELDLCLFTWLS
jgi:hypothetical protein